VTPELKNFLIDMRNKGIENIKVGALVLSGLLFLILTLYMIGKNRSLLGKTFEITAVVHNVNGLVPGNNVRFKGIDVGTVKSIEVANDTLINVTMIIEEKMKPFIKKNALATIGTDGLMGNKLVNINSAPDHSSAVEEGDVIQSRNPVETDEMLRTLNITNNNIERISSNLYEISTKLNRSESLWSLLSDSIISRDLKNAVADLRRAGRNTADLTQMAKNMTMRLQEGNGIAYQLFTDTTLTNQLATSLDKIEQASNKTSVMISDLQKVIDEMKRGEGTAGLILADSAFRQSLYNSAMSIEQGTARFNQNMEALKTNFLFKKYYKKMEKEEQQSTKASKE
jgi:phospholipid/cholesterol/gamma-HCH transport system substrate-binding protein